MPAPVWVGLLPLAALLSLSAGLCPPRCVCDDTALQADCSGAQLDSFPISLNPRLRTLLLAKNGILRLDRSMMVSSYKELEHLDLSDNRLESVEPGSFAQQGRLHELRLGNNRLAQLEGSELQGLLQLRVLDLSGNQLQELPAGLLEPVSLLEELNLAENQLQWLPAASVAGAVSLRRLRLADNQLQQLPAAALAQLPQLLSLDLSFNQLRRLRAGELAQTRAGLVQLNLEGNRLEQLEEGAFDGLGQLRRLVLSQTGLRQLEGVLSASLTSLEELYLNRNPLSSLGAAPLRLVPGLRLLSVSSCHLLGSVDADAFSGSSSLEELLLEDNQQLSQLPSGVFLPPPRLRRLSLRGCALTSLPADVYPWRTVRADLSENPWRCDCELRWLAELPANVSTEGAVCSAPAPLRGHPVRELTVGQLGCESRSDAAEMALTIALPCVLASLTLALTAVLVWRSRRRLGKRLDVFGWRTRLSLRPSKPPPPPVGATSTYYYRERFSSGGDGSGRLVPVTEL
ncbi:TLR4 interactor with leucine rich repeats-like [Amphibalanus amphitrite]|uniref:TLR4 interactor with leucine rich repeats-like n=1 Tax=Amphibalanus amphitrite TaxID=1232801 RepID=UPI001C90671E|nr:TLR4 interactor with leucine rich repeats-like [Amphibalanus amphitrite]XP_043219287.1 TLR4 interactor with leucine rich repeats-like [Amphibalanus amphitrite]